MTEWTRGLPQRPGRWWLYGYIHDTEKKELMAATVHACGQAVGQPHLACVANGLFIYSTSLAGAVWHAPLAEPTNYPEDS